MTKTTATVTAMTTYQDHSATRDHPVTMLVVSLSDGRVLRRPLSPLSLNEAGRDAFNNRNGWEPVGTPGL